MEEVKIDRAQAEKEVNEWLIDTRRMSETKMESLKDAVEALTESVSSGGMVINNDGTMRQTLRFPVENDEGGVELSHLDYTARLRYKNVKRHLKGIKSDDGMGMVHAHICGLVNKPMAYIDNLDFYDLNIARSIAALFL